MRDLDRSAHFYRDVLGWPTAYTGEVPLPFPAVPFTAGDRPRHELFTDRGRRAAAPIHPDPRVGMYHFGVKVGDSDDELREVPARFSQAGPPFSTTVAAMLAAYR